MKTGIIIPCYNEAKRLNTKAFISFIKEHDKYHLCFVNDGSKDNTLEVLNQIKEVVPERVTIIDVKKNAGKAAAVRSGARYLFNRKDLEYIGFIDADLSTDFNDFKKLVESLENNNQLQLVYGSRRSGKNNNGIKRDFFRNLFSTIITFLISFILGLPIKDTQCGAKVFKRNIIPTAYKKPFLSRWLFDVEIFIRLKKHYGSKNVMYRMREQALIRWVHVDDSKLGFKDAIKIPLLLLQIWFKYSLVEYIKEFHISSATTIKNKTVLTFTE